jgi:hypothetical protein
VINQSRAPFGLGHRGRLRVRSEDSYWPLLVDVCFARLTETAFHN